MLLAYLLRERGGSSPHRHGLLPRPGVRGWGSGARKSPPVTSQKRSGPHSSFLSISSPPGTISESLHYGRKGDKSWAQKREEAQSFILAASTCWTFLLPRAPPWVLSEPPLGPVYVSLVTFATCLSELSHWVLWVCRLGAAISYFTTGAASRAANAALVSGQADSEDVRFPLWHSFLAT